MTAYNVTRRSAPAALPDKTAALKKWVLQTERAEAEIGFRNGTATGKSLSRVPQSRLGDVGHSFVLP